VRGLVNGNAKMGFPRLHFKRDSLASTARRAHARRRSWPASCRFGGGTGELPPALRLVPGPEDAAIDQPGRWRNLGEDGRRVLLAGVVEDPGQELGPLLTAVRASALAGAARPGGGRSGSQVLPGGTGDVGGNDVGGVPVETAAGAVVANCGPWVSVGGGFLDISQGDASIEGCRYECVAECVRPDGLGHPSAASDPPDDPGGAVPIQPSAIRTQKKRPVAALADGQVERPRRPRGQRDGGHLAALAGDHQGPVPALDAQRLNVRADGFRHPQPVQGQQRDQRVLGRHPEPGSDQQRAELVAIQCGGVRLVVQAGPADMGSR
jgi:hypothetical protein